MGWGGALNQTPGLSQPISYLDTQSYTACFFALEARTNFEKRQSMKTGKQYSSEQFGGRVEGVRGGPQTLWGGGEPSLGEELLSLFCTFCR